MNRERAETYLRLLAEAELRDPALSAPSAPWSGDAPFITVPITLIRAAWALTAVGALDLPTAEAILADAELAVAARHRPEAAAASSTGPRLGPAGPAGPQPSSRRFPRRFAGGRPLARMSHLMPSVPALVPPPVPAPADAGPADAGSALQPFPVYCLGMNTPTPTEYLTLAHSALTDEPSSNFSMAASGGACSSACLTPSDDGGAADDYSQFTRVRLLVPSLVIDTTDRAFAFTRDPAIDACWTALTGGCASMWQTAYGSAVDCVCSFEGHPGGPGTANIDLRDTGFSIDPSVTFAPNGADLFGPESAVLNPARTVVNLAGGGCCGGEAASGPLLLDQN